MKTLVFSVAITALLVSNCYALTWTTNTNIPNVKRNHTISGTTDTIYVIGGRPAVDASNTRGDNRVYRGTINNAGVLTWVTETATLPGYRSESGSAVYNGRLYVWGGWDENFTTLNNCWYSVIGVGGVLGSFSTSAVTLPNQNATTYGDSFGRNYTSFNGVLYTINGEDNNATLVNVGLYSAITGGGDYGAWTATTEPGDNATWWHGIATYAASSGNYIYKIGGGPDTNAYTNAVNTVWRAQINAGGSLGAWSQLAGTIPATNGIMDFALAQYQNKIYVMGGADNTGTAQATVYVGTINTTTGDVTWATDTAMPGPLVRTCGYTITAAQRLRTAASR